MKREISKKEVIKIVRDCVSEMYRFGDGWKYNYWPNGRLRAGHESISQDYYSCLFNRSQCMIDIANDYDGTQYSGGNWTDYVK